MSHAQGPLAPGRGVRGTVSAAGAILAGLLPLGACQVVGAKVHNLEELHAPDSSHRYTAALSGDFEYVLRHELIGRLPGRAAELAKEAPEPVEAPADACLENLIALEEGDATNPVVAGRQVEWFARLAVEDPWQLSRERCVLALAAAGRRLEAGMPAGLGADQHPAGPEDLSARLAPVVEEVRAIVDRRGDVARLRAACDGVRALELDLSGARRALRLATEVLDGLGTRDRDLDPVRELHVDLQRICVRRAIAAALDDRVPNVRAAALASVAQMGGRRAIDTVLYDRLRKDPEPEVAVAIVDALAANGELPAGGGNGARPREEWLAALYALLVQRPESEVRVHAMMALSRLAGAGFTSLREEDWQAWWFARGGDAASSGAGSNGAGSSGAESSGAASGGA